MFKGKLVTLETDHSIDINEETEDCTAFVAELPWDKTKYPEFRAEKIAQAERIGLCVNSHDKLKADRDVLLDVLRALLNSTVYADAEGLILISQGGMDDDEHRAIVVRATKAISNAESEV